MKIFAIDNFTRNNVATTGVQKASYQPSFGLKMAAPLASDSVSFGAAAKLVPTYKVAKPRKQFKPACNTVTDIMEDSYKKDVEKRLSSAATTFLDMAEAIAIKLKDKGVSFDRKYAEKNVIKSPESYSSKIKRSRSFEVLDKIRTTLYVENPYDVSLLLDDILPEIKERGYEIAENYTNLSGLLAKGYVPSPEELIQGKKLIPDIDLRLADLGNDAARVVLQYPYAIGHPTKSGYEDIQLRLVKHLDNDKDPIQHELIILFGPNYAKAKHIESKRIYTPMREYDELLYKHFLKGDTDSSLLVARYIDLISKMFRGKISEKLYENAKNKDFYKIADEISINVKDEDITTFQTYSANLFNKLRACYSELRKQNKGNTELLAEINRAARKDEKLLSTNFMALQNTLEYFKSGAYKKDLQV